MSDNHLPVAPDADIRLITGFAAAAGFADARCRGLIFIASQIRGVADALPVRRALGAQNGNAAAAAIVAIATVIDCPAALFLSASRAR